MVGLRVSREKVVFRINDLAFFSFASEALVAGFYVAVTRSVTPIFLVANGYSLSEILSINIFAGIFSLLIGALLYKCGSKKLSKTRLLIAHMLERIVWFSIPFTINDKLITTISYGLAVASTLPTSIFMQSTMLSTFKQENYRRIIGIRGALGALSSILGQVVVIATLAILTTPNKYVNLYETAFIVGILSTVIIALVPTRTFNSSMKVARKDDFEAETRAANIFLLLTVVLSSYLLLSMAWIPRVMNDLKAPDYMAASIGFAQTVATIGSSMFWISRPAKTHRNALLLLTAMPLLVYGVTEPRLHLVLAMVFGFSIVGVNMYAAKMYSELVGRIGVFKAGILLASTNSLALTLASTIGYTVSAYSSAVFLASAVLGVIGLALALTSLPELAVIPRAYVQLYSRIIYQTSISSYNLTTYAVLKSAKTSLRIIGLSSMLLILFMVYRTLYHLIILTGG